MIGVGAAIALAASVVFVLRSRTPDGERTKGSGVQLVVVAGPQGWLVPVSSGDRVRPGDYLQAAYTSPRDGFGAVLSRDGAGTTAAYVPSTGNVMVALPAGTMVSFPESTVLDDVVGEESIVVLWCEAAHPLPFLLAQLDTGAVLAPAGCTVHRVVIDKRVEPR